MAWMKKKRKTTSTQGTHQHAVADPIFEFFECPRKHKLPHRVPGKGRCSPFDCCLAAGGAHGVVRRVQKRELKEAQAYAEETAKIQALKDRMRAWNEAHPVPKLPAPPPIKDNSIATYMKQRMEQVAPLALEMKIRKAIMDPDHAGLSQADDLLDRAGFTRNPGVQQTGQGPVVILNFNPEQHSPYEAQKRLAETSSSGAIDGQFTVDKDREPGAGVIDGAVGEGSEDE